MNLRTFPRSQTEARRNSEYGVRVVCKHESVDGIHARYVRSRIFGVEVRKPERHKYQTCGICAVLTLNNDDVDPKC